MNNPESVQRNRRVSAFTETLEMIKSFAVRGDLNDLLRCLACGIIWLPNAVAINTHQLGFLMSRCKSSINGSFQLLGYKERLSRKTASDLVASTLSFLKEDRSELRKWTVRCPEGVVLNENWEDLVQEPGESELVCNPESVGETEEPEADAGIIDEPVSSSTGWENEDAILESALAKYNDSGQAANDFWEVDDPIFESNFFF
jgi:hypothetical protein